MHFPTLKYEAVGPTDDRVRIATCSVRTPTDRLNENYSVDYLHQFYYLQFNFVLGIILSSLSSRIFHVLHLYNLFSCVQHSLI